MRLATRCRKGWPDLDVRTSLRGADGCRPVFSVVATPFRSVCRAQVGTGGAASRAARRAGTEVSRRAGGAAKALPRPGVDTHRACRHRPSLTVDVPANPTMRLSIAQVRTIRDRALSSIEMTRPFWEDTASRRVRACRRSEGEVAAEIAVVGLGGSGLTAIGELVARGVRSSASTPERLQRSRGAQRWASPGRACRLPSCANRQIRPMSERAPVTGRRLRSSNASTSRHPRRTAASAAFASRL